MPSSQMLKIFGTICNALIGTVEAMDPHFLFSNIFHSSCQQNIDDSIIVSNVVDGQEIVKHANANIPICIDDKEEIKKNAKCLDEYSSIADVTSLVSHNSQTSVDNNDCINIGSDETKQPNSILNDQSCEELGFLYLSPAGEFEYRVQREVKLNPVKYFNQSLLYYSPKFAAESDYIFFAQNALQNVGLEQQINIV